MSEPVTVVHSKGQFVTTLSARMKNAWTTADVWRERREGQQSNIPECCIWFYLHDWQNYTLGDKVSHWKLQHRALPGCKRVACPRYIEMGSYGPPLWVAELNEAPSIYATTRR